VSPTAIEETAVELAVENVGGIDHTEVTFRSGVTVLAGRNATNRTSLLRAIMTALGSEHLSLKGDAEHGEARLRLDGETYTRELSRTNGTAKASNGGRSNQGAGSGVETITTDGDPYLDDPELADLFAFLIGSNEARRAVARSDDLRELIMRPIDTDALQNEIERVEATRRDLDERIERLETLDGRLPDLEGKRQDVDERIEDKRETLEATQAEIDAADTDIEETRDEKAELDGKLEELNAARSAIDEARLDAESERRSIEALREERAELETDTSEQTAIERDESIESLTEELREHRDRIQTLETTISELQTIIGFNEDMLEGEGTSTAVLNALREARGADGNTSTTGEENDSEPDALTGQLLTDSETVCWTCGSEVDRERIEHTVERLREVRSGYFEERRSLRDRIEAKEQRKSEIENRRRKRERQERERQRIEAEINDREDRLADQEHERADLEDEVRELETEVEALQAEEYSDLLDLHKEANRLEFELGRLERKREDLSEQIETTERKLDERTELETRREEIGEELADLRGRIERIEEDAITEFNDHMETVLDLLGYANIERIWLERRETQTREGRRTVTKSVFDLHVIRRTDSGTTYEDTIDHLSESEREVTGLVFALAGYLAHDLYESMPFMLLDSLETIDSDRIAALVEYFGDYAEHVVVALLPEDAAALDEEYQRITEI
jgi:chromosome segregation ATPase